MDDVKILATGLGFPEGPVVRPDGSVILVELRNQRCSRVAPDGKVSLFSDCGGGPNGLAVGPDGFFYLCNNGGNRYVEGHPLGKRMPRHKVLGGVYYALPDGSKIVEVAYPILSPNGCGLSPDGKTLYVADTEGARLWAFEVQGPGKLKPKS